MSKSIRKVIMSRIHLLNKVRKEKTLCNQLAYKRQSNIYIKLLKKIERNFWKIVKPNFTEKKQKIEKLILLENDKNISEEMEVVKILISNPVRFPKNTLTQ